MKKIIYTTTIILGLYATGASANDFQITWSQISGGGAAVHQIGDYSITGTIGQFAPGPTGETMGYALTGGFWPGADSPPVCPADLNGDGLLNFFDVSQFLAGYLAQDSVSDFNGDGVFNFFDVSAFLAAFGSGCP